jgi:pimeloyl-ACP methyl ester carboxylesterase
MLVADVSCGDMAKLTEPARKESVQRIRYARNAVGHKLAYAVTGDGPPLLRFPPPLTMDLEIEWNNPTERAYPDRLSRKFRYLRFDHLGSGQSERVEPNFDFSAQADDAAAVADAAGFDRFAAWSMSGGALAAIHFAARYPERLTRLAIVGGYADGRQRRGGPEAPEALKTMIAEGWGKTESAFAAAFMTSYFPEGPLEDVRSLVRHMQVACPPELMLRDRDAINNASVAHLLTKVRCPTLILHARDDAVHPLSEAQKLAAGIPDAELVILETANHVPYPGIGVWELYIDTLMQFLEG